MLDALRAGRTDLVFDHLAAGGVATDADADGVPLLRWCAYYGDATAVRLLLQHGERLATLGDDLGLLGAAFHGHWRLCEFLLEHGADARHTDPANGETPLHAALCKLESPSAEIVVEVLLAHGADPNAATRAGAPTDGFLREARTRGETPLHRAAACGSEHTIELLLGAGAQRDARDAHGDTPAAWASWHLRPAYVVARLIEGRGRVHPDAIELSRRALVRGRVDGMERNLIGRSVRAHPHPRM